MALADNYRRQVALLVSVIPLVAEEECFALKGGTAINLFIRDMPRLSVDIDLTYLPVAPREDSLSVIDAAFKRIAKRIRASIAGAKVTESAFEGRVVKLFVQERDGTQIKIEVTPVLRGCVFKPEVRTLAPRAEEAFGFAEIQVVSFADLYAGKLVAALDRQHPRDLFDVRALLANEGIDAALRQAFIVYLLSHDSTMAEVLAPKKRDLKEKYEREFDGMVEAPVSLDELITTREETIKNIVGKMPDEHRQLLLSFKRGETNWKLLGLEGIAELPAVKWKALNLDKLPAGKRGALVAGLEKVLL